MNIDLQLGNCLDHIKTLPDNSIDLIFCDPPYALGSEVIIKPNGKPDYKKAIDFMNKWDQPDGTFWEEWFIEAKRVLKHGGHCLMFGMDRQLWFNCYYANLSGFTQKQSLYWYFISNFPKASDLSKNLDKHFGAEREFVGVSNRHTSKVDNTNGNSMGKFVSKDWNEETGKMNLTAPSTPLAKKYEGIKYSVAPLKQTCEVIMVFQKPYKTGSCLHDVLALENGDDSITCGGVDIEGNRCGVEKVENGRAGRIGSGMWLGLAVTEKAEFSNGRFPAQTYIGGFNLTIMVLDVNISLDIKNTILSYYGYTYLHTMQQAISNISIKGQRWEGQVLPKAMLLQMDEDTQPRGKCIGLWQEKKQGDNFEIKSNLEKEGGEHNDGKKQSVEGWQSENEGLYSSRLQTFSKRTLGDITTNDKSGEQESSPRAQSSYGNTYEQSFDQKRKCPAYQREQSGQQAGELDVDGFERTQQATLRRKEDNKGTETGNSILETENIYVRIEDIPSKFIEYFLEYKTVYIGASEIIDLQSGVSKNGTFKLNCDVNRTTVKSNALNNKKPNTTENPASYGDSGGASRILHRCNFEAGDYDLYHYCPKVSKSERNEGLEGFEEREQIGNISSTVSYSKISVKNNHPTLKPKALLSKILKLFKTPNNQVLLDPFMGSGSMGISAVETGFDYIGIELNSEYFKIAKARIQNAVNKRNERLF
jgi:DNA modification methylase